MKLHFPTPAAEIAWLIAEQAKCKAEIDAQGDVAGAMAGCLDMMAEEIKLRLEELRGEAG